MPAPMKMEYDGKLFESESALCRYYGVNRDTFRAREKKGLPMSLCLMNKRLHTSQRKKISCGISEVELKYIIEHGYAY